MSDVQYGCECDCAGTGCGGSTAPVAYRVERDGEELLVCTRCDLGDDTILEQLVDADTDAQPFVDYDALGALCLSFEVGEESKR